jgi:small subunit ribosomal protein S20
LYSQTLRGKGNYYVPIIKSAIKRVKQTAIRRERNIGIKKDIKAAMKAFTATPSSETLSKVHSELDKALKKNLLKKNTVARRKASVSKLAKEAGVKISPAKKTAPKATVKSTAKATTVKKTPAKDTTKKTATKKPAAKK